MGQQEMDETDILVDKKRMIDEGERGGERGGREGGERGVGRGEKKQRKERKSF